VAAELAMLRVFRERPDAACVYIGPLKALVRERMKDWRRKFVDGMGMLSLFIVVVIVIDVVVVVYLLLCRQIDG
jgi:activating signal cointegrator complex subunit 3